MSLKKFTNKWEKVAKLSKLVESLGKAEDFEEDFRGKWGNFLEFLQTEYEDLDAETIGLVPNKEDPQSQLNFARQFYEKYRVESLRYGLKKIGDITEDLNDKAASLIISGSIVPVKDFDLDKSEDLESLIKDYEDKVDTLEDNLNEINKGNNKDRYEAQQKTVQEYKGFVSLLKDYGDLVENVLTIQELTSYASGGENNQPNIERMRDVFFKYLDNLLESFKDDKDKYEDNLPVIETVKALSGNQENLTRYYVNSILLPAQEKYQEIAKEYDLKDYVERTSRILSPDRQKQILQASYSLGKQEQQENREKSIDNRIFKLYPPGIEKEAA
jgi:hypothetical protein